MAKPDLLEKYRQKRNFGVTPEPADSGEVSQDPSVEHALAFVIQKHWASHLHYDFRLEFDGTLKSWAVPKGPSLDPHDKRMAVQVEDHPLSYGSFEGTIPPRQYGAGQVIIWDSGSWLPLDDPAKGLLDGKLKFELRGHKLQGRWTLVRMRGKNEKTIPWLLIKEHDAYARPASDYNITEALPNSVKCAAGKAQAIAEQTAHPDKRSSPQPTRPAGLPPLAVRADLPPMLEPQLATLVASPPDPAGWLYELKFDGYRLMSRIDGGQINCFTRNGHDWTAKMPQLATALKALGLASGWLDGEIIVPDADGIPNFQALQGAFEGHSKRRSTALIAGTTSTASTTSTAAEAIVYYLFDLPFYAGHDLRDVPLSERRALLQSLLKKNPSPLLRFSDTFDAPSKDLMASACKLGFEGLIGKRADAPYQSRRSTDWIKLKCGHRQEFLVCGYTDPKGSRNGLGALLLGVHDTSGKLQYAGNVGSGFNEKTLADLRQRFEKIKTQSCPFDSQTAVAGRPHWVQPKLLAEVSFAEWTATGRVRHAVFRGLRADKKPQAIIREKAMQPVKLQIDSRDPMAVLNMPKSLRITHPERVIDARSGVTKLALVQHYAAVSSVMMPHLKGRPVSLVRAPTGISGELFFQKHAKANEVPGVKLLDPALDPGHDSLLEIASVSALLSAAQMNTLEFHTWNASAASIDRPDRMTFDLDPGENLPWQQMLEAATLVRTVLDELGLVPFLKTSGGKGLHVVVPIKRLHDWNTVKGFSQAIVQHLASTIPQRFVAKSGPKNRVGKIFVDYLRNGFGATTVSAWSARARPGMGVSVPVEWDELASLTCGAHWTVQSVGARLATGNTPWAGYAASTRSLSAAMKMMHFKPS